MMRRLFSLLLFVRAIAAQKKTTMDIRICVLSSAELAKCNAMSEATWAAQMADDNTFGSYFHKIQCTVPYRSPEACMRDMSLEEDNMPNLIVVDAGDLFNGGRYHSLVPILREVYNNNKDFYHAVAVLKKGGLPNLRTLEDLRGTHACFAGVGTQAGWTIPLYQLIRNKTMPVIDCNNPVKSTAAFFGDSCAVNALQNRYNPLGDNSNSLCERCGSNEPGVRCTIKDPYSGFRGALACLQDSGDVAFVKHTSILDNNLNQEDFELLCLDGSRAPVSDYLQCSWGVAPGHFVLVSSTLDLEERYSIQTFMTRVAEKFQGKIMISANTTLEADDVFESFSGDYGETNEIEPPKFSVNNYRQYGTIPNLIFQDDITGLIPIKPTDQIYRTVLQQKYGGSEFSAEDAIQGVRRCGEAEIKLCVTSLAEYKKCQRMRLALNAQLIKPSLSCVPHVPPYSHRLCMEMIKRKEADVAMFEAGDVYRAGRSFGLVPIMAEVYNLGEPEYYAVAVVKIRDNSSELIYLKKKNSCHTGLGQAAGWIIPMSWLIANERVRDYGCDSVRAAGEYFSKSCVPGVRNPEFVADRVYNSKNYWDYGHLCDLCHGSASHYCDRTAAEDYYGHTGAFRCLVEGGGDVAFVKHTTVMENCDGKRHEWWARNQLTADFQLLCRDGTRKKATEYRDCYLGKIKGNALVTHPSYLKKEGGKEGKVGAFLNLFEYAQQFYGQKQFDQFTFSMFYSEPPYADLIFQDATQRIIKLSEADRDYRHYLGREFIKAVESVECFKNSARPSYTSTVPALLASLVIILLKR